MTAIDELRAMLDKREVDYRVSTTGYSIDIGPYTTAYANRSDTTLDVSLRQVTPEQAIAATLGTGTCHDTYEDYGYFRCSECGGRMHGWTDDGSAIWFGKPRYCPNCGAKVVEE